MDKKIVTGQKNIIFFSKDYILKNKLIFRTHNINFIQDNCQIDFNKNLTSPNIMQELFHWKVSAMICQTHTCRLK
jgi:hypothetical protein